MRKKADGFCKHNGYYLSSFKILRKNKIIEDESDGRKTTGQKLQISCSVAQHFMVLYTYCGPVPRIAAHAALASILVPLPGVPSAVEFVIVVVRWRIRKTISMWVDTRRKSNFIIF
jgi:hypothetical protein